MNISNKWIDYECISTGNKEKLERWGNIILNRPDPQIIWNKDKNNEIWNKWDGFYHRSTKGGGEWEFRKNLGVGFDVGKIQNFNTRSEEYIFVKSCKNQYDLS